MSLLYKVTLMLALLLILMISSLKVAMCLLNGGVVSRKSSKQDTVADSTIEVEYMAAVDYKRCDNM